MRIGIDLDGVCYDFGASVREYLRHAGIRHPYECPDPQRWEFYEDWGLSLEEFLTCCHRGAEQGIIFSFGDPHPGTREAMLQLRAADHSLHIVTDRSFGKGGVSEGATKRWLEDHDIPFDSLTFSPDKTVVRLDAMVDDKLANYDALEAAGVAARLFDRPWNQSFEVPRSRVASLAEFAEEFA